ncbi:MAG: hypothetical protein RMJ98_23320 [Myxococcales bacterium]|nr:hypothetical protein [Myxococcales bacterium]
MLNGLRELMQNLREIFSLLFDILFWLEREGRWREKEILRSFLADWLMILAGYWGEEKDEKDE